MANVRTNKLRVKPYADQPIVDLHGNVLSDIYGDVHRDINGYVIIGLDGVIRDALGYVVKDDLDQPLIAKWDYITSSNTAEKLIEQKIKKDEVHFDSKGRVAWDQYGLVKRNNLGNVIVGPEGIIRDFKGFALYNKKGEVLQKGRMHRYNKVSKIDPFNLPIPKSKSLSKNNWSKYINKELEQNEQIKNLIFLCEKAPPGKVLDPYLKIYIDADSEEGKKYKTFHKKCLLEKKVSEFTAEDKKIMDQLLNIKVPEGYYPRENLVVRDLINPDNKIIPNIDKILLNIAPGFFLKNNPAAKILAALISLVVSDVIPYPKIKKYISDNMLKIINKARQKTSFLFSKIMLTLFKEKPKSLEILKNIPISTVLPIILGTFTLYAGTRKNIPSSLSTAIQLFTAKTNVKIVLDTDSPVGQTRVYLQDTGVLSKGETTINLEKLGLFDENSAKDNSRDGIKIRKNTLSQNPVLLFVELISSVPYLKNTKKNLAGEISIIKNEVELNKLKMRKDADIRLTIENLKKIKEKYIIALDNIVKIVELNILQQTQRLTIEKLIAMKDNAMGAEEKKKIEGQIKEYRDGPKEIQEKMKNGELPEKIIVEFAAKSALSRLAIRDFVKIEVIKQSLISSNLLKDDAEHAIKVVLHAANSMDYSDTIRSNLNIIDDITFNLNNARKDLHNAKLKNINLIFLRINDTESVLNSVIRKIRIYEVSDPLSFYLAKGSPVSMDKVAKELNEIKN